MTLAETVARYRLPDVPEGWAVERYPGRRTQEYTVHRSRTRSRHILWEVVFFAETEAEARAFIERRLETERPRQGVDAGEAGGP